MEPRLATPTRPADADAAYRKGIEHAGRQDFEQAAHWHQVAAEAGDDRAAIEFARLLLHGHGVDQDGPAAIHWLEQAEAKGNPVAAYLLAWAAVGGVLLPRDARINQRLLAAVRAGYTPAQRAAAVHFGRKPAAEAQRLAIDLLERAATAGDVVSAQLLAERLRYGEGCEADPGVAAQMRERLEASGVPPLPDVTRRALPPRSTDPRQLDIEDAIAPVTAHLRAQRPRVATVDSLLGADECRLLVALATPRLHRSMTVDPVHGTPIEVPLRTSSDAHLDPLDEDLGLRLLQLRMCAAAGIELAHAEPLTVLRYQPGEEYRPHRDYMPPGGVERDRPEAGNRLRTICVYLNDVEAGGATAFPIAGVEVSPLAGRAVIFENLHADGRPDPDSLHAGTPVLRGVKWLATLWLRQHPYRRL
jgi:hypothetical protein